jgi:hypothetical protein
MKTVNRYFWIIALVLFSSLSVDDLPAADHSTEPSATIDGEENKGFDFELSVHPAGLRSNQERTVYVVKLKKKQGAMENLHVGEVRLWWTNPKGIRTTIDLRPVQENLWASRLDPGDLMGIHQLAPIVIFETPEQTAGRVWQQVYSLALPELTLVREKEQQTVEKMTLAALGKRGLEGAREDSQKRGISIPLISILVVMLNLFSLATIGGAALIRSHPRRGMGRLFGPGEGQRAEGPQAVAELLTEAGLLDESGGPMPFGERHDEGLDQEDSDSGGAAGEEGPQEETKILSPEYFDEDDEDEEEVEPNDLIENPDPKETPSTATVGVANGEGEDEEMKVDLDDSTF